MKTRFRRVSVQAIATSVEYLKRRRALLCHPYRSVTTLHGATAVIYGRFTWKHSSGDKEAYFCRLPYWRYRLNKPKAQDKVVSTRERQLAEPGTRII
jgi:hypothetical protein